MDRAQFDAFLLRSVVGSINAKAPRACRKIAAVVSEMGLAAEGSCVLSNAENSLLAQAITLFQDKLFTALSQKVARCQFIHKLTLCA